MSIHSSKYESGKTAMLKQLLENAARSGKPIEYEIKVDEIRVIPRTSDPAQFDSHEEFITGDTRTLTIILYEGQGKSSDKHIFTIQAHAEQAQPASTLSGTDIDKKVEEKVEAVKKQLEYDKVVEENKALKEQVKEAEEFIETLEKALELEKQGRLKIKGIHLGEIASVAAEGLIRRNTHWLKKVLGMEGLAGLIEEDTQKKEQQALSGEETEATFSKKQAEETLSEEDKELVGALRELQAAFEEKELAQVGELVHLLMDKPQVLSPVLAYAHRLKEGKEKKPIEEKQTASHVSPAAEEKKTESGEDKSAESNTSQLTDKVNQEETAKEKSIPDADADTDAEEESGLPESA